MKKCCFICATLLIAVLSQGQGKIPVPSAAGSSTQVLHGGTPSYSAVDLANDTTGIVSSGSVPWATPGTIGSTTPSTGAFTALSSSGILSNSQNGAASASAVSITGTPFTGGSGTTTFPLFYLNSGGTAPTSFSTSGTVIGINAPSGFVGRFLDFRVNGGTQAFSVGSTGGITTNSDFTFSSGASKLTWSGRSVIQTPSDGVLELTNNAGTDFTRLQFGGTTSSFPSIKRNATALNFRLADDSADAPITVGSTTIGGGTPILKVISATATLDFGNLAAVGCEDLTITVTGAALGDDTSIGVPNGSVPSATFWYSGWVSATNTVTIRGCTLVSGDPASGTFRATVTQF